MTDLPAKRIDRDALERIIRRAAELQAGEMDRAGDGLSEQDLLKLGADVGIDGRFLRQAMYEEGAGGAAVERGFLAKWIGQGHCNAGRVVPGDRAGIEQALVRWMTDEEALTVKRRLPDAVVWEPQKGFFAEMKRGFGVGGRSYALAKAVDVTVTVRQLEPGYCHVEMRADLTPSRNGAATAGGATGGVLGLVGAAAFAVSGPPGLIIALAAMPLAGAALIPLATARAYRRKFARVQLALEQVLDRLEHGEIRPHRRIEAKAGLEDLGSLLFGRVSVELRRALDQGRHTSPRQLPPGPRPPDHR